ncbi:MAG: hypothetical protein IMZ44_07415 [Planctomycetes bacterium]|nr:hypothetical protein [Planctomycetota bacterium]
MDTDWPVEPDAEAAGYSAVPRRFRVGLGGTLPGEACAMEHPAYRATHLLHRPRLCACLAVLAGAADTHVNAEVRALLAPLSTLAADCKITLLTVTHMNKGGGTRALYRAMGSLAFIAAARAAWLITPDPDDPARRFMLPAKLNLAEWPNGLAYRIGQVVLDEIGPVARVEWEREPVMMSADEALASGVVRGTHGEAEREAAVAWLTKELSNGEMAASDVQAHAMLANIHIRQLKFARKELDIRVTKSGYASGWRWSLPDAAALPA